MSTIDWPFRADEALAGGDLNKRELYGSHYRLYPGVWVPCQAVLDAGLRARAAWLWSRRRATVAGISASALLGAKWVDAATPVQLLYANRHAPESIEVRGDPLLPGEDCTVAGMEVTTAARTAFDLGRWLDQTSAVQRIDALMNATGLSVEQVLALVAEHPGERGLARLIEVLGLVDGGSESPYETLVRLLLVRLGFPRPQTQVRVYDDCGMVIARIDLGWPEYRVGVDFEGKQHWTDPRQREKDMERYPMLGAMDWIDIRLTALTYHCRREVFLSRVEAALLSRGCPKTWNF